MKLRHAAALAAAALAALAFAGPAAAAGPGQNAQAGLYSGNAFCGGAFDKTSQVGFVNFHRSQDETQVAVNFHLKGGQPGTVYNVDLFDGFCNFVASLGTATTNDQGVANLTANAAVPASASSFFVFSDGFGPSGFADAESVAVTLG